MTQRLDDLASLGGMSHPLLLLSPGVRHIYLTSTILNFSPFPGYKMGAGINSSMIPKIW